MFCDSNNIDYSMLAVQIRKTSAGYGWYRMRISMPTYGLKMYSFANPVKTAGLSLPLYVAPFYPYSSGSNRYFGFVLGIFKVCLTTINNLAEPVRKLDGQVMKITYDIVDEEE